jgi:hypothetical protein
VQNGPLEISYTLSNEFAHLYCGNGRERFRTSYPSWPGAQPGDEWGAQMPWYHLPSTLATTAVNHMWPVIKADELFYYLNELNWTSHPDFRVNQLQLYMSAMSLSLRTATTLQYFVLSPIDTCAFTWHGVFVNNASEPLLGTTNITKRVLSCDRVAFTAVLTQARAIVQNLVTLTNYADLQMAQTQLQFLAYSDAWQGCKAQLYSDFFALGNLTVAVGGSTRCLEYTDTDPWRTDPCCNVRSQLHTCCMPGVQNITYSVPMGLDSNSVNGQCSVSQCALQNFNALLSAASAADSCTASFNSKAGAASVAAATDFYKQCRHQILGDQLQGIPCTFDSDCIVTIAPWLNGTCNLMSFTCSYGDVDVLLCWTRTIDPLIARSLFDLWRIPDAVNETRLLAELQKRFVTPTCIGPTGIHFRENYNYASDYTNCFDLCYNPAVGIDIQPYCFEEDATYCPIPTVCSTWIPPNNWCWRQFFHRAPQPQAACVADSSCNWLPCSSAYNASCALLCNASAANFICIECTQSGGCVGLPGVNASACQNYTLPASCSLSTYTAQATCEASGICVGKDSSYAGQTIFQYYNRTGLCFSPFITDFLGSAYCGGAAPYDWPDGNLVQPEAHYGCVCSYQPWSHPACNLTTTQAQCGALGFLWVNDDQTQAQCTSAPSACFTSWAAAGILNPSGVYNRKPQSVCLGCSGEPWQTVNQWQAGVWTTTRPITRIWTTQQFAPTNTWQPSIDYIGFGNEIARATIARVALAYSTEALCRYGAELDALAAYTCDCTGAGGGSSCYPTATSHPFAVDRACPYIASTIIHAQATVDVPATAFPPAAFCQNIYLASYPATAFQSQLIYKLSSEVFLPRSTNPYAVVRNAQGQVLGEILTDGLNITWTTAATLQASLTLCLPTVAIASYPNIGFGSLNIGGLGVMYVGAATTNGSQICFSVNEPGIYFGVSVANDAVSDADRAMFGTSAGLYTGCLAIALAQAIRYVLGRRTHRPGIRYLKPLLLAAVILFCALRVAYMLVVPNVSTDFQGTLVLFEFPTVLFFCMVLGIFYIWREIAMRLKDLKELGQDAPIPKVFWLFNAAAVLVFLMMIVLFYTVKERPLIPCLAAEAESPRIVHATINQAYLGFIVVASMIVIVGYLVMGIVFLKRSSWHPAVKRATASVLLTFAPMFFIKSVLVIWSAATGGVVPVLAFAVLELIPVIVLLYYILPWGSCVRIEKNSRMTDSTGKRQLPSDSE